ncbi:MAG: acetoin utilization protein AcuC [Actinomycetota bacterium]|nr:acetoin utilization protein AcuC [Actinomycetota bacterium]MDH5223301.1 acetoin utilization protein AcuC [Actinomycetota bacterium]
MSGLAGLVVAPGARIYDHGPGHPLRPERVLLTWDLIAAYGIDRAPGATRLAADVADDETVMLVHTREFVEATRDAGHGVDGAWGRFGYGPGDNPIFDRMHEAGAIVTGASVSAAGAVLRGEVAHAFNAAGGLHHAMADRASGFCVYDDPAVAIAWMLRQGLERIAYVDVDVHHGDGPQAIFWNDRRVLTVSIHEYAPQIGFFPGTGAASERGGPDAPDSALNVPLAPGTGDGAWLEALRTVALPAVRSFHPDVLVTQLGCDTHVSDPLAHLALTTSAYRRAASALHELAHEAAGGRWVATGGGGYQWARVVPRAWTLYFAEMAGVTVPDEIPQAWIERARSELGDLVPTTLSDRREDAIP